MAIKPVSLAIFLLVAIVSGVFLVVVERIASAPYLALGLIAVWSIALLGLKDDRSTLGLFGELGIFTSGFLFLFIRSSVERPLSLGNAVILERLTLAFGLFGAATAALALFRPRVVPRFWLFLFAWAIAYLSTDKGGPDPMLRFLLDTFGLSQEAAQLGVVIIRKALHFSFYGALAWVAFQVGRTAKSPVLFAVVITLSLACFDELRQASFGSRSGSFADVVLDMAGVATVLWFLLAKQRKPSG